MLVTSEDNVDSGMTRRPILEEVDPRWVQELSKESHKDEGAGIITFMSSLHTQCTSQEEQGHLNR